MVLLIKCPKCLSGVVKRIYLKIIYKKDYLCLDCGNEFDLGGSVPA